MSTRHAPPSDRVIHQRAKAREFLQTLVDSGGYPLAERTTGMKRGYLHSVLHGKKTASRELLVALKIIKPDIRPGSLNLRVDIDTARAVLGEIEFASDAGVRQFAERLERLLAERSKSHNILRQGN